MFFKNLTLFRFSPETASKLPKLEAKLPEHKLRPCGPLEMTTRGWVSPYGIGSDELMHTQESEHGRFRLVAMGGHDKILPMATVNHLVAERCKQLETERGRPVGARERRKIKEDVLAHLMPHALTRPGRLAAYFDLDEGWLVIDTASRKQAENFVSQVRETLGSFPAVQAEAEESPRAIMTEWLINNALPEGFEVGDEIELKDPADRGAVVRCRRQDLGSEEIREHLKSGKQVVQLALVYRERISFVLDDLLTVRKFKLLDMAVENLDSRDRESAIEELNARCALMTLEVDQLLGELTRIFSIHRPQGK